MNISAFFSEAFWAVKSDQALAGRLLAQASLVNDITLGIDGDPTVPMHILCRQMQGAPGDTIVPQYGMDGADYDLAFSIVAFIDGKPVGQISIDLDNDVHLGAVFVDAGFRRRGIATDLCAGAASIIGYALEKMHAQDPALLGQADLTVWGDTVEMSDSLPGILQSAIDARVEEICEQSTHTASPGL